jgi:2-polyprenyl-3-methyl-5-hydroxy-6-metoxy-1,4-benzoquinol methylase
MRDDEPSEVARDRIRHKFQRPFDSNVVRLARTIYSEAHGGIKYKQVLRPYICPFHILIDLIPSEANILDVACGAGLFISLLARLGRIESCCRLRC